MKVHHFLWVVLLAVALVAGCSGGGNEQIPVMPDLKAPANQTETKRVCWGLWQFEVDMANGTVDIAQLRQSDLILNVLGFLEPPALTKLSIDFTTLTLDPVGKLIKVDVILTHPLVTPTGVFHGFDVHGIVMGPEVLNADGYTPVMNPADFAGVPFGYQDGLLGAPNSYGNYDDIWGYKYFADKLGLNDDVGTFFLNAANLADRGVFREGSMNRRHYELSWANTAPPIDFLIFNYAVYANYDWPLGDGPYAISDFPISTANSAEAFCAIFTETANSLWYATGGGGGNVSVDAEIFDWQGLESTEVILFADGVISDTLPASVTPGSTSKSMIYHFVDVPATPTAAGNLDIFVKAVDIETFGSAWFLGLLPGTNPLYSEKLYVLFRHTSVVSECPLPTVTAIDPLLAGSGDTLTGVLVTGTNFKAGPSLAVKLKKSGQTDIEATNEAVVSATQIKCDISIPGTAAGGAWDVEVINGCSTKATGPGLFTIIACGEMKGVTGYTRIISTINSPECTDIWGGYAGMAATQTGTPYVIGTIRETTAMLHTKLGAMKASSTGGLTEYVSASVGAVINRDVVCDTNNRVYFTDGTDYTRLRYFPFDAATGFGTMANFGNITAGWSIYRITIDENDNPVILGYQGTNMQVFHWNGTSWNTTPVPSTVVGGSVSAVTDFDWNLVQKHYVFVRDMGGSPKTANLYAITQTAGTLVKTLTDIFKGNAFTNGPGIYIDVKNASCRIITWGGYVYTPTSGLPLPFLRLNAAYGPGTVAVLSASGTGYVDGPRGQWAKGTNTLITGAQYLNCWAKVYLPSDW